MDIRTLNTDQTELLRGCLLALADYHNGIPSPFAGEYPPIPIDDTLVEIATQVREGRALVEAVYEGDEIVGFCKTSATRTSGMIDHLFVHERHRGKGYGGRLLERALAWLRDRSVSLFNVMVVDGNPAQTLYEKHGFQTRTLVMSRKP